MKMFLKEVLNIESHAMSTWEGVMEGWTPPTSILCSDWLLRIDVEIVLRHVQYHCTM